MWYTEIAFGIALYLCFLLIVIVLCSISMWEKKKITIWHLLTYVCVKCFFANRDSSSLGLSCVLNRTVGLVACTSWSFIENRFETFEKELIDFLFDAMNRVGAFLKESKSWLSLKEPRLCFVVGNESCDLDSAMSAICLAYFYSRAPRWPASITSHSQDSRCFVPVMNIDRVNLPLKTEVTHLMRSHDIDASDLVCR